MVRSDGPRRAMRSDSDLVSLEGRHGREYLEREQY